MAPVWERGLRGPGDWREERPRASAEVSGSAKASSGGADLGTQVEFSRSLLCARRWDELPEGDVASGGFEKWKAEALLRASLARVSRKLGAAGFLRHLSPSRATVTSPG